MACHCVLFFFIHVYGVHVIACDCMCMCMLLLLSLSSWSSKRFQEPHGPMSKYVGEDTKDSRGRGPTLASSSMGMKNRTNSNILPTNFWASQINIYFPLDQKSSLKWGSIFVDQFLFLYFVPSCTPFRDLCVCKGNVYKHVWSKRMSECIGEPKQFHVF